MIKLLAPMICGGVLCAEGTLVSLEAGLEARIVAAENAVFAQPEAVIPYAEAAPAEEVQTEQEMPPARHSKKPPPEPELDEELDPSQLQFGR